MFSNVIALRDDVERFRNAGQGRQLSRGDVRKMLERLMRHGGLLQGTSGTATLVGRYTGRQPK